MDIRQSQAKLVPTQRLADFALRCAVATAVVAAAKSKEMPRDRALDALLRMDRKLQSHARVKATYAYRPELLAQPQSI